MPRRDGTGPMGEGPMTGRGCGPCECHAAWYGAGHGPGFGHRPGRRCNYAHGFGPRCGRRHGYARGCAESTPMEWSPEIEKELLQKQRDALKNKLDFIDKRLESLENLQE